MFSLPPEDSRKLEPYLPSGLVPSHDADAVARVQGEFKRRLLTQRLHPGEKVPLDDLAESLVLSRTPVREAMRALENQGLVVAIPNRGFAVRRIEVEEVANLYEARRCVEARTAEIAFVRRDGGFLEDLRALHDIYERVLSGAPNRRRLGMLADKAFHLRIAKQAGNPFLAELLANVFDRLIFTRSLEGFPLARMGEAIAEHAAVVAAFRGDCVEGARDAVIRNIENGGAAIVAYLREIENARIAI